MSTDKSEGLITQEAASIPPSRSSEAQHSSLVQSGTRTPLKAGNQNTGNDNEKKPAASTSASTSPSTPEVSTGGRQVIAVSASKGPTAFFNLARKFLVTDEMCDLSALEGAIVSAVDAAHLLERSKLATIVRVQTSYVSVEPKRKKVVSGNAQDQPLVSQVEVGSPGDVSSLQHRGRSRSSTRELRRARIVITVKRTENYKTWLDENPLQAIIAGDTGEGGNEDEQGATQH